MIITPELLTAVLPRNPHGAAWAETLNAVLPRFAITTPQRIAAFLAQTAHESLDYTVLEENLNYSAAGLLSVFHRHFDAANVNEYAHQPMKIANRAYANRNGNGDEASGDGWRYRGRGLIQLTGRNNYALCSHATLGSDYLTQNPDAVKEPANALRSACWFWNNHSLNALADAGDIDGITHKINGGTLGTAERAAKFHQALELLSAAVHP